MKQQDFILRVPATNRGRAFIEDLKEYLNNDTYKVGKLRYTGKRVTGFSGHTRMDDAKNIRVYLEDKRQVSPSSNLQELMHEVEHFRHRAEAAEKKLNTVRAYLKIQTVQNNSIKVHLNNPHPQERGDNA